MIDDGSQEAASFQENVTGIDRTLFILPHALRVALNPPNSLNPACKIASVSRDGDIVAGEIEPTLLQQVRDFIERNRETLIAYWEYQIDIDELRHRLKQL